MTKTNWLCFGMPVTDEAPVRIVRVSRLPTFRHVSQTLPREIPSDIPPQSPRFDERTGAEKKIGMGKWRKSQKRLREMKDNKEVKNPQIQVEAQFQERAVDVPEEYSLTEKSKENKKPENIRVPENMRVEYATTKSCTNTPNMNRNRNRSKRHFSRSKKATQSLPSRRVKNFVPYDP